MMNLSEYQKLAARTECNQYKSKMRMNGWVDETGYSQYAPIRLNHAIIGMSGEVGELASALQKWIYYGKPLDNTNIKEELGDLLWYMAEAANALDIDLGEIAQTNIDKLRVRYPEKFSEEKASNRDLLSERKVLEGPLHNPTHPDAKCGMPENYSRQYIPNQIEQDGHGFGHVGPSEFLQGDPPTLDEEKTMIINVLDSCECRNSVHLRGRPRCQTCQALWDRLGDIEDLKTKLDDDPKPKEY